MAQMCVDAGLAPRDRNDFELVESSIPTLIVNGDWDPITPPPLAERIAPGFSNGRLIIVPYAGHGPTRSMSECGGQVLTDFYDDPTQDLTSLDASCLEKGVDAPVFLDYVSTDIALRMLARATDDPKNIVGSAVLFTLPTLIALAGFLSIVFGYFARKFSSHPDPYHNSGPGLPRLLAFLNTLLVLTGLGLIGAGVASTAEISEISIVAGIAPPAGMGALVLLVAVLVSVFTIVTTVGARKHESLRKRSLIGFLLISVSTIVLVIYLFSWGITPW